MNLERHRQVIAHILAHPESWNQAVWHSDCGTEHCYAGLAQMFSMTQEWRPLDSSLDSKGWRWLWNGSSKTTQRSIDHVIRDAREWLDLTDEEAEYLFDAHRNLQELEEYAGEGR